MANKDNRFVEIHKEGSSLSMEKRVLVDRETGVQYLYIHYGYSGGLTPLLDRDGKPLIGSTWDAD